MKWQGSDITEQDLLEISKLAKREYEGRNLWGCDHYIAACWNHLENKKMQLKKLYLPSYGEHHHDCVYLQKNLRERGYDAELTDIQGAWERYSESMAAGWMCFGDIEDDINTLLHYLEEVEE